VTRSRLIYCRDVLRLIEPRSKVPARRADFAL